MTDEIPESSKTVIKAGVKRSGPRVWGVPVRVARPVLIGVVALDLLALAAFSVRLDDVTRTTTTPASGSSFGQPVTVAPPVGTQIPVGGAVLAPGGGTAISSVVSTTPTKPTRTTKPTTPPGDTGPPAPPGTVGIPRCPIPIKKPTSNGGLQSLIDFAPAFGPFSAEAFAAASAYQPLLQLIGPILAEYPKMAPTLRPLITPFLTAISNLENAGFTVIGPLYSPHREAVLEAEGKFAAALAPYSQKLVASPLGGCVVELQSALLDDAGPTTTSARSTS